jgi:enoyl-CoA hydratase/carnithine racemase
VLLEELRWGDAAEHFAGPDGGAVVVRITERDDRPDPAHVAALTSLPFVVIAVTDASGADPAWRALSDVVVPDGDPSLDHVMATVTACPRASIALALLLRGQIRRTVDDGLVAESAVYSALQAGPEFAAWRASRPVRGHADDDGPRVRIEREGAVLRITLTRPTVRNALDARMRDELLEALRPAVLDAGITRVELHGEGPAFCAGGDLDEFGTRSDPATAHLIRLHRSVGRTIAALRDRTTAHLHGACIGSGIELAAFAGTVVAHPDTTIALPEIGLGLVPGAGGTVSLPARIGRLRTAWLALSGGSIDAATARRWGLVDAVGEDVRREENRGGRRAGA